MTGIVVNRCISMHMFILGQHLLQLTVQSFGAPKRRPKLLMQFADFGKGSKFVGQSNRGKH